MHKDAFLPVGFLLFILLSPRATHGQAMVTGIQADTEGMKRFQLAISTHYRVPETEVVALKGRKIRDEELAVVFHMARCAHVTPGVIAGMRLEGKSWMDITLHFGLSAEVFHVQFERDPGPPYGKAWGYFKNRPRSEWRLIRLSDDEAVNLINLKFLAEHHGCSPEKVLSVREEKDNIVSLGVKVAKLKPAPAKDLAPVGSPTKKAKPSPPASPDTKGKGNDRTRGGGKNR